MSVCVSSAGAGVVCTLIEMLKLRAKRLDLNRAAYGSLGAAMRFIQLFHHVLYASLAATSR